MTLVMLAVFVPGAIAQAAPEQVELWGPLDGSPYPSEPIVAVGGGQAATAWSVSEEDGFASTIYVSRRGEGGSWGALEAISRNDGARQNGKQGLALDSHGNGLLAWEGESKSGSDLYIDEVPVGQAARPAVDFWHDVGTINGINAIAVSFDSAGNATVMWRAGSGLYLARRPDGGSFGQPVRIADEQERESVNWPSFAGGANGDVVGASDWNYGGVAAWVVPHGSSSSAGAQVLQHEHAYGGSVRVAIAPSGEAIAAWYTEEPDSDSDGWLTVATRSPGAASFSAPRNIDRVPNLEGLALAVSPSGEASLIYNKLSELVDVRRMPSGAWQAPAGLGGWATGNPAATYDAAGDLSVAWYHYGPYTEENVYNAATRLAGGAFEGHPQAISSKIQSIGSPPAMAASDTGGFAAWTLSEQGRVEATGPFQAPSQDEAGSAPEAPVASAPPIASSRSPTAVPDGDSLTQAAPGDQPTPATTPAPPAATIGVAAAKVEQNTLGLELNTLLEDAARRLGHIGGHSIGFQAPMAGVLTVRIARPDLKGLGVASGSVLLGRWALRSAGHTNLHVARSRALAAALATRSKLVLTATFQAGRGKATTAHLEIG